jgi:hypothetical protein
LGGLEGDGYYPRTCCRWVKERQRPTGDELARTYRRFIEVREQILLGYGLQPIAGVSADLEDIERWL